MTTPTPPDPHASPSEIYGAGARLFQDVFATRALADRLANRTLRGALDDGDIALIRAQSTVWIATVDAEGWPDVSYKGGAVGFVEVRSPGELRIPVYDGNGMMRTIGNIADTGRVALLFVDTGRPWRIRVHGTAHVSTAADDLAGLHGADAVIVVRVGRAFQNCGRYIHQGDEISPFVPRPGHEPPVAHWKRYAEFREVLRPGDPARERPSEDIGPDRREPDPATHAEHPPDDPAGE